MWRACLLPLAACSFDHGLVSNTGADASHMCTSSPAWWDPAFASRFPLSVSAPAGYTLQLDASTAFGAGPDVRVVVDDGTTAREIDRLVDSTAVTFQVPTTGSVWLYAGQGTAAAKADPKHVYLFSEDFEGFAVDTSPDAEFIPQPAADWTIAVDSTNHVYRVAGINRHAAAIRIVAPTDVEIAARMRFGAGGGENQDGLAVRGNSMAPTTMDGFVGQLMQSTQRARIAEYTNGATPTELTGVNRTAARSIWYGLRLRVIGDVVSLYVDDALVATTTKAGSDGTMLGLFTYNSDVDYDDVRVRMAASPEPTATIGAEERCE